MDKLSLELLTNRRQYRKYLDKVDPKKFEETEELRANAVKYRSRIMAAIKDHLYDTTQNFNAEIDEILPTLMRQFIKFFELQDMEKKAEKRYGGWQMDGPDEEDAVDSLEEREEEGEEEEEEEEREEDEAFAEGHIEEITLPSIGQGHMKSYWGKLCIKKG